MPNVINIVSEDTFSEKMDAQNAILAAIAANNGGIKVASWKDVQSVCRLGLASKMFSVGDQFVCKRGEKEIVWDIIDFDHDEPIDTNYKHSISLQTHYLSSYCLFDAPEALFKTKYSGLPAGKYAFEVPEEFSGTGTMLTQSRQWTFDVEAKIDGEVYLMFSQQAMPTPAVFLYARSENDTSAPQESERIMLRSGYEEDAEDLAEYVQRETGSEYIMNHPYRASSGSEEWHSSVVRQFLNGDNTNILGWWKRQGMYDRQPAEIQKSPYFLDANPFRYELDDDFVTVLGKVKKKTAKHQFFGGEIVATEDLFFLPAASELNPSTAEVDEGDVYSYYKGFSGNMYAKNFAGTTSTDEQWTRSVAWRPDGHPSSYGVSNVLSTLWGMVVPGLGSGNRAARSYCYMAPICNIV